MKYGDPSHDIHRDGIERGWPRLVLGETVVFAYPEEEAPAVPGVPRPCLIFGFGPKWEDESDHVAAVIYGTGIHKPDDIKVRQRDGLALTLLHPTSWRSAGLTKATIFLISRWTPGDYTGEWFSPRENTPILGRLTDHDWRAFLDILFIDGFVDENDSAAHWHAYDGPLFGTIQKFRSRAGDMLKPGVILATPWKQADGSYVEIAPVVKYTRPQAEWMAAPLTLNDYGFFGRTPCTIDFAAAQTLPLSPQHFPNAPRWSRRRLTLQDRCYARSLWAGWQHDSPPSARRGIRSPPPRWTLPRLPDWP